MFIYDELVKHEDMEMSGNIPEEEEVNDEEQEEHFEIGSEYTKKERKNLRLLRCCICDDFVKEPFFLCIKSACLGKRNLYCYECYVDKWCKHNNKPIGACRNGCEFDPSSSDLEMRKPPVQRFDQHSKEISKDAKRRIKEILNKGINMNYDLIYLLQQYLGYQKEDEKEELKEEVKEEPIEEPIEETKETSDEKDSKESQEKPQKEPQEEPQKEPQEEPQKEPQEEPQEGTNNNSNIKHPEDPERQKRWERFLHAFKVFTSSNIFIRIYNQNHIQDLRKFISKENLEIIDEKIKQIEPLEKELRELKEAQKNHIYNNQIQSKSNQESLEEVKEVATSDDRSNRSAARSIPSSKSTNIASKLTSDPNAFSDGKSAIKGIAKFVTSIKNNFLMITFRRREQEKLQLLHSKEHTLQDCKKYSRFSIECFRLIDIESLDRSKLIKFCKILEDIGTTLNFLVFSQFRFRHLNQISDSTLKYKEMKRGRYDVDISIECANSLMFIEKREKDDHFRAIKINPDDEDKATPSDHFYANLDSEGIQAIRPDKLPDPNDDDHKAQFAFKVIRTPVRGKTYIIGGKTNKSIRHMTTGESGRPIIKQVYCKYTVDAVKEFDLFDKTSTLFRLRTDTSNNEFNEKEKVINILNEIIDIKEKLKAKQMMRNKDFRLETEAAAVKFKKDLEEKNISGPFFGETSEMLRNKILIASSYIMKHPEGITEEEIREVFSDANLNLVLKNIEQESKKAAEKAESYYKEKENEQEGEENFEEEKIDSDDDIDSWAAERGHAQKQLSTVETQIKNLTEDYVQRCIIKKKQLMIEECNRVLGKLGYSEL